MTRGTIVLSFRGDVPELAAFFSALRVGGQRGSFETLSDAIKAFAVDRTWNVHAASQAYERGELVQHFAVDLNLPEER